jgi:F-type H+-transporting ATPase subunit b
VLHTSSARMTAALVALSSNFALAADAGGSHQTQGLIAGVSQGVVSAVVTLVVFGISFGILAVAVWPKILKGLKDRENKIREEIESAEMARAQAKDALEQYQNSLAQARAEASKMLETTRAQQAALAADLKSKADAELSQMRERAVRDIESAKRAAVAEIYSMTGALVNDVAAKILRRNVNGDDTNRLIQESLGQLENSHR